MANPRQFQALASLPMQDTDALPTRFSLSYLSWEGAQN